MSQNTKMTGAAMITIAGVLLFSTKAVFVKVGYELGASSHVLMVLRMLLALPFFVLVWLREKKEGSHSISSKDTAILIGLGLLGYYAASYLDFTGLNYISASVERLLLFVYPTLVLVFSWMFFGTAIKQSQIIAVLITYAGVFLIFADQFGQEQVDFVKGGVLVLLSAVSYAIYVVGSGYLIGKMGAQQFTNRAMVVACIGVLFHGIHKVDFPSIGMEIYGVGVLLAVFCTVLPSYLIAIGIKRLGASNVAILGAIGPLSTISLAFIFLGETLTSNQLVGGVIVVCGVLANRFVNDDMLRGVKRKLHL